MNDKTIRLNDRMHYEDKLQFSDGMSSKKKKSLWDHTEIIGGYDLHKKENGISELGEVIFKTENMVPIGGVQYAMEQIFKVKGPLNVGYLNDLYGIGVQGGTIPDGKGPYPEEHGVCLFCVGTGGAASNGSTVIDIPYEDRGMAGIVPFRYTNDDLGSVDSIKYYGKKVVEGVTGYYLKRFDSVVTIKHLYRDGLDGEDGSVIDEDIFTNPRDVEKESLTEILLTVNKKDIKEWFKANGGIEETKINSIALVSGVYNTVSKDYERLMIFSKLNIPTEHLSLSKDLHIIYRVYGR